MKKTVIILSAVLALVACNKNDIEQPSAIKYTYDITITRSDDSKAVKTSWESGDVVYVFFSNVEAPKYLKFTYDGSAWERTQYNGGSEGSFSYPGNGTMTAIYLPYGNDAVVSADGTSFTFDKSFTSYFLKAEKASFTVSGSVVSGKLNMEAPEGFVQFAMPLSGTVNETATTFFRTTSTYTYTLSDSHIKPVSFASVSSDGTITTTVGNFGDAITGYVYGDDIIFSGVLNSSNNGSATAYVFTFKNNNGTVSAEYDDVTYKLSGTRTLSYKSAIKFPAISSAAWEVPEPEFVEINGVKWAKWNIGATAEGGYGDYFAWGATYPQAKYEISDYRESGISGNLTPDKDVAYQKLGTNWHIPTQEEINSIYNTSSKSAAEGVTWTLIFDTSIYGTEGYEVFLTSDSGKKIFLPASGYWYNVLKGADYYGVYWSTKFIDSSSACYLYFDDGLQPWCDINLDRYVGQSVRPVHN